MLLGQTTHFSEILYTVLPLASTCHQMYGWIDSNCWMSVQIHCWCCILLVIAIRLFIFSLSDIFFKILWGSKSKILWYILLYNKVFQFWIQIIKKWSYLNMAVYYYIHTIFIVLQVEEMVSVWEAHQLVVLVEEALLLRLILLLEDLEGCLLEVYLPWRRLADPRGDQILVCIYIYIYIYVTKDSKCVRMVYFRGGMDCNRSWHSLEHVQCFGFCCIQCH